MKSTIKFLSILALLFLLAIVPQPVENNISSFNRTSITASDRDYWPTEGWQYSTPEEQGMDSTRLQEMMDYIDEANVAIQGIVIVRNGYIVHEAYPGTVYNENSTHLLYSVTKSFTSSLVGIAIDQGYIDNVSIPMLSFFPDYEITNVDERRERITIEHLLTMRSGMFWDENSAPYTSPANGVYQINTGDGVEFMLNSDMVAEPGELWHYNTGASHLLSAIVQVATGMTTLEFAEENLFEPLGISEYSWSRDMAGWYKGGFDLRLTPRDMAKFGYLFLNNGSWDGHQIVSEEWVRTSTSTITRTNDWTGYGYQWWTNTDMGVYSARGLYGQYIFVIPEYDIVVAFTSGIPQTRPHPHETLLTEFIIPNDDTQNSRELTSNILTLGSVASLIVPGIVAGVYYLLVIKRRLT